MSLLDFLFGKPNFHRFDDSYTLDRDSLFRALREAIESQQALNKVILIVVHFPDAFEALQDWLDRSGFEYGLVTRPIDLHWISAASQAPYNPVQLALSDLIGDEAQATLTPPNESNVELAMMVCQRHPIPAEDERLERFARAIPVPTQLGYFIALDDPVVKSVLADSIVSLLKQFGMGQQELVASNMLTKRLNQLLKKSAAANPSNLPADSAQQWLDLNRPPLD